MEGKNESLFTFERILALCLIDYIHYFAMNNKKTIITLKESNMMEAQTRSSCAS